MQKAVDFLKNAEVYYLATVDGDQPRVRPFGTAHVFEGKLYIQTGKVKDVSKQIHKRKMSPLFRTTVLGADLSTFSIISANLLSLKYP